MDISKRDRLRLLAGAGAAYLTGCSGGGSAVDRLFEPILPVSPPPPPAQPASTAYVPTIGELRDQYRSSFAVGAAIQPRAVVSGSDDAKILSEQFSSITAENVMKPASLAPSEGTYTFEEADRLVDFAIANGMQVRGHALLWHIATPDYFFEGTPTQVRDRLERYITDVVTHFKGRVFAWDVVNEVVNTIFDPPGLYRQSEWFQAAGGKDYIDWAFQAARAADPDALLFLNDYNTETPEKLQRVIDVVRDLQDRGIPIDGIGHQMHINVDRAAEDVLAAIDGVDEQFMGLINHVTELDISLYNDPGSCWETGTNCQPDFNGNVPQSLIDAQAQQYRDIFQGLAERPSVTSVTTWGLSDGDSWLNSNPVERFNSPLLFDRDKAPKTAFRAITDPDFVI
jgi:endo-1,4-beta-xylanase